VIGPWAIWWQVALKLVPKMLSYVLATSALEERDGALGFRRRGSVTKKRSYQLERGRINNASETRA
jgi:hypothetical protein